MPQLTMPAGPFGLPVDVLIGVDASTAASLKRVGQPIPLAIQARGLLDTCSDMTLVDAAIIRQIGAAVQLKTSTQTAGGSVPVNIVDVRLSITDARTSGSPLLMHSN